MEMKLRYFLIFFKHAPFRKLKSCMEAQKRVDFMERSDNNIDKIVISIEMERYKDTILKKYAKKNLEPLEILEELNEIENTILGSNKAIFIISLHFYTQMKVQSQNPFHSLRYIVTEARSDPKVKKYFMDNHGKKSTIPTEMKYLLTMLKKNEINLKVFYVLSYFLLTEADKTQKPIVFFNIFNTFQLLDNVLGNLYEPKDQQKESKDTKKIMKIEWSN